MRPETRVTNAPDTMSAEEFAERAGVHVATILRNPPMTPIRIGRRVLFPRAAVLRLLGIGEPVETTQAPVIHSGRPAGARTAAGR
jgi:hypothetical protein